MDYFLHALLVLVLAITIGVAETDAGKWASPFYFDRDSHCWIGR